MTTIAQSLEKLKINIKIYTARWVRHTASHPLFSANQQCYTPEYQAIFINPTASHLNILVVKHLNEII